MALIEWREEFKVGVASVDYEHESMIALINELHAKLAEDADKETVLDFLGEILAKISAHFALEEQAMREMRNPHYASHKAEHDEFLEEVTEVVASFGTSPGEDYMEAFAIRVKEWILIHITTTDRQLVSRGD